MNQLIIVQVKDDVSEPKRSEEGRDLWPLFLTTRLQPKCIAYTLRLYLLWPAWSGPRMILSVRWLALVITPDVLRFYQELKQVPWSSQILNINELFLEFHNNKLKSDHNPGPNPKPNLKHNPDLKITSIQKNYKEFPSMLLVYLKINHVHFRM